MFKLFYLSIIFGSFYRNIVSSNPSFNSNYYVTELYLSLLKDKKEIVLQVEPLPIQATFSENDTIYYNLIQDISCSSLDNFRINKFTGELTCSENLSHECLSKELLFIGINAYLSSKPEILSSTYVTIKLLKQKSTNSSCTSLLATTIIFTFLFFVLVGLIGYGLYYLRKRREKIVIDNTQDISVQKKQVVDQIRGNKISQEAKTNENFLNDSYSTSTLSQVGDHLKNKRKEHFKKDATNSMIILTNSMARHDTSPTKRVNSNIDYKNSAAILSSGTSFNNFGATSLVLNELKKSFEITNLRASMEEKVGEWDSKDIIFYGDEEDLTSDSVIDESVIENNL